MVLGATLSACRTSESSVLESSQVSPLKDEKANRIHESIVSQLKAKFPDTEDSVWFASTAKFDADWIVQSPSGYWGKLAQELPKNLACEKGGPGCDTQFLRHLCSVDTDCAPYNTGCQALLATVKRGGEKPRRMCLGSGDQLMNRFYRAMTSADYQLDITSLTFTTGRFYQTLVNALAFLSHKSSVPNIRLLFSGKVPVTLNAFMLPTPVLTQLLHDIDAQGGDVKRLRIDLGWVSNHTQPTWNHAKIIVADQNTVLEGGHNPWDEDYLSDTPIFDLSMEMSGPVGNGVSRYISQLWDKADLLAIYDFRRDKEYPANDPHGLKHLLKFEHRNDLIRVSNLEAKTKGTVPVIGLGRLGYNAIQSNKSINAADEGIRLLIRAAQNTLYFAQQDIYKGAKIIPLVFPSFAMQDMYDAILRGVKISIVKSDQDSVVGYGMVSPIKTYKALMTSFIQKAQNVGWIAPNSQKIEDYMCEHLELLPWRFNDKESAWPGEGGKIGAHSKLIIADESAFYIGSQNLYPSNLEEFGVIVSDSLLTKNLMDEYWNPLFYGSAHDRLPCKI